MVDLHKNHDVKWFPTSEYRFFLFDPEGDGLVYFRDPDYRDEVAKSLIPEYLDDGEWYEEITQFITGEVTGVIVEIPKEAPMEADLTMKYVDYELHPLKDKSF